MMDKHLVMHNIMGLEAIGFSHQEAIDLALDLEEDAFPENHKPFRPMRPEGVGRGPGGGGGTYGGGGHIGETGPG